jgi:TRAP-type C4-dicarboxylate transport system substrate-binding protein
MDEGRNFGWALYHCLNNDLLENGLTLERALEENLVTFDEAMLHYEDLLEHGVEFSNTPEERETWKEAFDTAYREYAEQVRAARAAAFAEES